MRGRSTSTINTDFRSEIGTTSSPALDTGRSKTCLKEASVSTWIPNSRAFNLFSYFVQDEITLVEDRLFLTLGSKFEHNEYTQFEFQPTAKLLYTPSERQSLWGAVSRAVRTPGRIEADAVLNRFIAPGPTFLQLQGNDAVESENLLAFEVGYRAAPTDEFNWDVAIFYNRYDDLIGTAQVLPFLTPAFPASSFPRHG